MTANRNTPHVLIVDDDPLTRMMAVEALREGGFTTVEAENGERALAAFDVEHPDLILLDVVMPGLSGFEVCRRLRAQPAGELVPIIMLTGLEDSESVEEAFHVGATDFISKPINWTLLRFRIRYVLRSAQVMKELVRNKESLSSAQRITVQQVSDPARTDAERGRPLAGQPGHAQGS